MTTEREWFDGVIESRRGTGRTTRMINAANAYAKEHPDQYVLVVAANQQHKRHLRTLLTEDNTHVCIPYDEPRESRSYHVSFWDHYAAEQQLRYRIDDYDKRVAGMIEYTWWHNPESYDEWEDE